MATIGNVTIRIGATAKQLEYDLKRAENALKRSVGKMQGLGQTLSLSVTAPLALAGAASFKMASDVEESLNKVRVAFGSSAGSVEKFADSTLNMYGIARGTALDMSALFGDMATSMGLPQDEAAKLSTSLVGLGGDLASFKNISLSEVQTALSGIFTGETESLKRLGIVMTEANVQAFALTQGITKKFQAMTQAEKVALRYNYVLTQTKNAQGDFARTSDGAANQMRIFQESMKELGASFGQVLLPVITPIIQKLNDILKSFKELSPETKKFIVIVAGIAATLGPAIIVFAQLYSAVQTLRIAMLGLGVIGQVVTFFKLATTSAAGFSVAMKVLASATLSAMKAFLLNPVVLGLAAAAGAVYLIYKNWELVKDVLRSVGNFFIDIGNYVGRIFNAEPIKYFSKEVKNVIQDLSKLKGFENLQGPKISQPIGVLAPTGTTQKAATPLDLGNLNGGAKIKDLNEQISDLKKNIEALGIAYATKPSAGILERLNSQIDILKSKENILENADNLITRLSGGSTRTIEILPTINFSGAIKSLKDFATTTANTIRTETKQGLLDGLTLNYNESGFSEFFKSLSTDLSNIQRQFDDGLISGLEKNGQQFDFLKGKLDNLTKNGFGKLSPEVIAVKGELDKLGGFTGFTDMVQGIDKINSTLGKVGEVVGIVSQSFSNLFTNQIANIDAQQQKEIDAINQTTLSAEEKEKRITAVEERAAKERRAIKRKQAIADKLAGVFAATVSMFISIAKAAELGPVFGIPAALAMKVLGAANIAAIAAAPLPSLAIGTDYVKSDGMALLHRGEAVVPANVVGGGFSQSGKQNIELHSIIRGNDLHLLNERNKALTQRMR